MKKKLLFAIFFILIVFAATPTTALAAQKDGGLGKKIEEQLDNLNTDELEEYLSALSHKQLSLFGASSFKERVRSVISGDFKIGYQTVTGAVLNLFFGQITDFLPIFVSIAAICLLCALLSNFKPSSLSGGTGEVVFFVAYSSVVLLIGGALFSLFSQVTQTITGLKKQMDIVFPILLTLMAASGGAVSASVYKPAAAFLSAGIVQLITYAVLPLTMLCAVFSIVGNLSENFKLNKFIDLFKSANKWILGISLTVFTVFLTVQGLVSSAYDGISIRAVKYAISNSVPLIGGFLSSGFDLILAGSAIIKNAVGGGAVILLFITVLTPIAAIAAFGLFLKLTAAVTEPLDGGRVSALLSSVSGTLSYLTAALLSVSFMYFITALLLVCSSSSFF